MQFYVNYNVEFSMIGDYFECVMSVKYFYDVRLFGDKFKRRFIGGEFVTTVDCFCSSSDFQKMFVSIVNW